MYECIKCDLHNLLLKLTLTLNLTLTLILNPISLLKGRYKYDGCPNTTDGNVLGISAALSHFWREVSPPGPTRGTIAELDDDWMRVTSVSL